MSKQFRIGQIVPSSNTTTMLRELDLEPVAPGAGALLSGAY
ncbi:hypothetical protein [Burkholderia anthina]